MSHVTGEKVALFVHQVIFKEIGGFGPHYAMGFLDRDGVLEAGVVFHNYHPEHGTVELSIGSRNRSWLSRERIKEMREYVVSLGCHVFVTRTDPENLTARSIMRRLGGSEIRLPDMRGDGRDEIVIVNRIDNLDAGKFGET